MLPASSCKTSVPAFLATPGPSQEEEIREGTEEIERLSGEASFFSTTCSDPHRIVSRLTWAAPSSVMVASIPNQTTVCEGVNGSLFTKESEDDGEEVSDSIEFSCFDAVRLNYLEKYLPSLTFQPDSSSFPPIHRAAGKSNGGEALQEGEPSFFHDLPTPSPSPSLVTNARFMVAVDEPAPTFCGTYRPKNDLSTACTEKPVRHGGKENENRMQPAVRRKPVPKVVLDEKVRSPSVTKFSSTESFSVFRGKGSSKVASSVATRAFKRTDEVRGYTLCYFLSQGAQGKVYLAKTGDPLKVVAIKVISKLRIEGFQTLLQEQRLLKRIKGHPFVLDLLDSFHDTENFYLITDYYPGGDLAHLLYKLKMFETDMARFYISELIIALKYLHANHIVHRDLKPGNILIKADGHICLGDFGLCRDFRSATNFPSAWTDIKGGKGMPTNPTTNGFAGTLVYMSPQAITQEAYSYETDWWSMGIILYELLQGDTPWVGSDVTCMIRKIKKEPLRFHTGVEIDEAAKQFLQALLKKAVVDRISPSEFPMHRFFIIINFSDVEAGLLTPPYVPRNKGGCLALGKLGDAEKIYVGRTYDAAVDPFPDYNYDYTNRFSTSPLELEQVIEEASKLLGSGNSPLPRSSSVTVDSLSPRPVLGRRRSASQAELQVGAVVYRKSQLEPTLETEGEAAGESKTSMRDHDTKRQTLPRFRTTLKQICSFVGDDRLCVQQQEHPSTSGPQALVSVLNGGPDGHVSSGSHLNPGVAQGPLPTPQVIPLAAISPRPPTPSFLPVSSASLMRANSLFSVNLTEGCVTQTTMPSMLSIVVGDEFTNGHSLSRPGGIEAASTCAAGPCADTGGRRTCYVWLSSWCKALAERVLGIARNIQSGVKKCFCLPTPVSA